MKTNILIMIALASFAYAMTIYFESSPPKTNPQIIVQPNIPTEKPEIQKPAPDFTFTINNKTHALKDFEGKNIILNFWASWCAPCVKEFPNLLRAAHENPDSLVLIALSSDLSEEAMQNFLKKMPDHKGENIFIALDKDQKITRGLYQSFKLPETWLIDSHLNLSEKIIGGDWEYEELEKRLELLQGTSK